MDKSESTTISTDTWISGPACLTNILDLFEEIGLDFAKELNKLPHKRLTEKLQAR